MIDVFAYEYIKSDGVTVYQVVMAKDGKVIKKEIARGREEKIKVMERYREEADSIDWSDCG